uniref:Uncharacterized protein n=1 Tax=Microcebus murinus TaxID=30608 RepID=A0A8C5YHE2_MICMU
MFSARRSVARDWLHSVVFIVAARRGPGPHFPVPNTCNRQSSRWALGHTPQLPPWHCMQTMLAVPPCPGHPECPPWVPDLSHLHRHLLPRSPPPLVPDTPCPPLSWDKPGEGR